MGFGSVFKMTCLTRIRLLDQASQEAHTPATLAMFCQKSMAGLDFPTAAADRFEWA
jgi:hypothetical protein